MEAPGSFMEADGAVSVAVPGSSLSKQLEALESLIRSSEDAKRREFLQEFKFRVAETIQTYDSLDARSRRSPREKNGKELNLAGVKSCGKRAERAARPKIECPRRTCTTRCSRSGT